MTEDTCVQVFFENLTVVNIVLKTSSGFRFYKSLKQAKLMILVCQRWKMQEDNAYIYSPSSIWEIIPFFGPAVSCPEINGETLGKTSKTVFQLYKITV